MKNVTSHLKEIDPSEVIRSDLFLINLNLISKDIGLWHLWCMQSGKLQGHRGHGERI